MSRDIFHNTSRDWSFRNRAMLDRLKNVAIIVLLLAAWGWAGGMDMEDAIAIEAEQTLNCRDKLNLRVALTADEAAGRCDQPEGNTK